MNVDPLDAKIVRFFTDSPRASVLEASRVLKVARTLADLDGKAVVSRIHLAEAISYRIAGERLAAVA